MSAANAKVAAEAWIQRAKLPESLRGRVVQIVVFTTEEDCRFFYPRRALIWQQQVNTYISRAVFRRKGRIARAAPTPADYHAWRGERADSETLRRGYVDPMQRLLELPPE